MPTNTSKHNPLFRNAAKAFLDRGWPVNALLPGIPVGAQLHPSSKIKNPERYLGKIPGRYKGGGAWVGLKDWSLNGLAGAKLDPATVETWPTPQVCIPGSVVCGFDMDCGQDVIDILQPLFEELTGGRVTSVRKRDDGSARCMVPFIPDGGLVRPWIDKYTRGSETISIEIKGRGTQWVGAGRHPTGCKYVWTSEIPDLLGEDMLFLSPEGGEALREAVREALTAQGWVPVKVTKARGFSGPRVDVRKLPCMVRPEIVSAIMAQMPNTTDHVGAIPILSSIRYVLGCEGDVWPEGVRTWAENYEGGDDDPEGWLAGRWFSLDYVEVTQGSFAQYVHNNGTPALDKLLQDAINIAKSGFEDEPEAAAEPGERGLVWREVYAETEKPKPTWWNCRTAIKHLRLKCSFNVFRREMLIGRSDASSPTEPLLPFLGVVADATIVGLRTHLSKRFDLDFTEKHVRDAVISLAFENKFDPILDLLAEAQANWDGKARLDRFAPDYLNSEDTELNRQFGRKTLIAMATRARQPGCKFDTMPVTESGEGWNKSSVWPVLAGDDNFSDQRTIGLDPREVMEQLGGVWVHENADLAGLRKTEIETVKGYLSRRTDKARAAYGHLPETLGRRWIEVGTTNGGEHNEYLLSQTGNRRFWPIKVLKPIDLDKVSKVRLQLLGEAAYYESKGESLVLPEHLWAAAGEEQEKRRVKHPFEEELRSRLMYRESGPMANMPYWGPGKTELRITTQALFRILEISPERQEAHAKQLANSMRAIGWDNTLIKNQGRGYRLPADKVVYAPDEERDEDGRQR